MGTLGCVFCGLIFSSSVICSPPRLRLSEARSESFFTRSRYFDSLPGRARFIKSTTRRRALARLASSHFLHVLSSKIRCCPSNSATAYPATESLPLPHAYRRHSSGNQGRRANRVRLGRTKDASAFLLLPSLSPLLCIYDLLLLAGWVGRTN